MQQPGMNFALAFPKPKRPGTKPSSKPSALRARKVTDHPETPDGQTASATPTFPSQGLPQHIGASHPLQPCMGSMRWPLEPSRQRSQLQRSRQHPLVFITKRKKPPPATGMGSAPAPCSTASDTTSLPTATLVTAQAAVKRNHSRALDKWGELGRALASLPASPSSHSSFSSTTQQSPSRENHQQHSENPSVLPTPLVASQLSAATTRESQEAPGAGILPPCLEIISPKEGFAITSFPRSNQSSSPAAGVTMRARTEPLPRTAGRDHPELLGTDGDTGMGSQAEGRERSLKPNGSTNFFRVKPSPPLQGWHGWNHTAALSQHHGQVTPPKYTSAFKPLSRVASSFWQEKQAGFEFDRFP